MRHCQSNPTRPSNRRPLSLAAAVAAVLLAPAAYAAPLTWDPNAAEGVQDGAGNWNNLGLSNWNNGTGNVQWNSSVPDEAIFGGGTGAGAAGTVTLTSNVTVGNITFNAPGSGNYTIAAGSGFSLGLSNTTIFARSGTSSISAPLTGTTGLRVINNTGSATSLRLSGANTYSGLTEIGNGNGANNVTLRLDSVGALGNSTQISVKNGSSLMVAVPNSTSTTMGAGTTLTIEGNGVSNIGALRGADTQSNTWAGNITIASNGSRISGGVDGTLTVTGVISGTGSVLYSRTRNATTILNVVNTYTGDTMLYNDALNSVATLKIGVDNAINANSRLVSLSGSPASAQMDFDLNGHVQTLRSLDTSGAPNITASSSLYVTNNAATASVLTIGDANAASTARFAGSIMDGVGSISLVKQNAGNQILVGSNTYAGSTTVNGGKLQIGDATPAGSNYLGSYGSLSFTSGVTVNSGATFEINNLGLDNNSNDRLSNSAAIALNGGTFVYYGSDQTGVASSETIGGITRVTGGGIGRIYGVGLGKDSTATDDVSRVFLQTAPTLVGTTPATSTGINASAKDTQIVPYLLGFASPVSGGGGTIPAADANGNRYPNTFLTYNAETGLRPLNPIDEFSSTVVEGANVRLTNGGSAAAGTAINSLIMASTGTLTLSGKMTNTSGAFLFAQPTGTATLAGGNLDLGSTEAIMSANNNATAVISTRITGTAGITIFGEGNGTVGLGNPDSTFSGDIILRSGIAVPQVSSKGPAGAPTSGPFGTGTIVFAGGRIRAGSDTSLKTLANPVRFQQDTMIESGAIPLELSGPVTLEGGSRTLTNGNTSRVILSGNIGDGGNGYGLTIVGSASGDLILGGANTYTGRTNVERGRLIVSGSIAGETYLAPTVGNTSLLGGSGTLKDVVASGSGATVNPGNAANVAGILKTGAFSLSNGAHLSLEIGGVSAGGEVATGYDQLVASGTVTLTGGDLKLSLLGTPDFGAGAQLFLVVNNSGSALNGTFATLNGAAFNPASFTLGGQEFRLEYNASFTGAGSDGIANDIALVAVPEPGTAAILLGGVGVLALRRRRR